MSQITAVTVRYDMLATAKSMHTVQTRLQDEEIQQVIKEIDDIRNQYMDEYNQLRADYADLFRNKLEKLQKLLNPDK